MHEAWKRETYVQSFSSESAVKYLHVGRRKIQISPPLGQQDQSNALPQGQQRRSNPHPMPCLPPRRLYIDRCINPKRFSKEGFSILGHECFVLAQSIFFGIFTHGQGFQNTRCPPVGNSHCTFTKIFLGIR